MSERAFREEQQLLAGSARVVTLAAIGTIQLVVAGVVLGIAMAEDGGALPLWIIVVFMAIECPLLLLYMARAKLVTRVDRSGVFVKLSLTPGRTIAHKDIRSVQPLDNVCGKGEVVYGCKSSTGLAIYTIGKQAGVELILEDGKQVRIGSRKPKRLLEAIERYR